LSRLEELVVVDELLLVPFIAVSRSLETIAMVQVLVIGRW
jgi:hypothetical protein